MSLAKFGPLGLLWVCLLAGSAGVAAQVDPAQALRAGFAAARAQASDQLSDRPVYLQSVEQPGQMAGEVHALIDLPYARLRGVLRQGEPWCGLLILHLNTQYCRVSGTADKVTLVTGAGRKFEQPLADLYWVRFAFDVQRSGDDYLAVELRAPNGPLGTTDVVIAVEALPFDAHRSLLHLRYSYAHGVVAGWAVRAYLATLGSDKLGFSQTGQRADGQPIRVGGVRGVVERNTMRYFLAIEAYLGAESAPAAGRVDKRLQDWFDATERYPLQLHEIEREDYLAMKRRQLIRQRVEAPPPDAG
jgi:hypothetical protein